MNYTKPKVLISKCLEFDACRYDGQLITNKYVKQLKKYIDFITVCPEVEIGLGIPRDPIHLINSKNEMSIYQPTTNKDLGKKMINFSRKFIGTIKQIDGMILKSKSPSCAISSAKHYPNTTARQLMGRGSGLFANYLINAFPHTPKEEETRLNDMFLREHFYTSIFVIADFRNTKTFKDLYAFHAKHKLLFMSYNQLKLKELGRIAANHKDKNIKDVLVDYYNHLLKIFSRRPRYVSHINTQTHAFGYYKNELSKKEKMYFLDLLEEYRNKKIPASSVNSVLNAWNMRFNNEYLLKQSYFAPYPIELIEIKESRMQ